MPRFGLVGPAYRSQSVNADCQTLMNLYLEYIESGQGKSQAALYRTPGLATVYNLGAAGVRGLITAQGRTFAVAGTVLWELLGPTTNPNKINRGAVLSDGLPVSLAYGPTQLLIVSAGTLYCYQLVASATVAANTLTPVAPFDASTGLGMLGTPSQVVYCDGFFFALMANSNQIQASNPLDGSSWPGVAETGIQEFPDNVVAIAENQLILFIFGPNAIQPYFNAGTFPFPFASIEGVKSEHGLAAPFSIAKLDNSLFFLGGDQWGQGIVWRINGYQPQRVSTHAMEYEFSTYATLADAVGYAYQDQGHTIYQLNFPTAQKSWCYDTVTQTWFQKGYFNQQAGIFTMHRAGFHTFNFGMHLVGDPTTGAVYQQSITIFSDFGNPIRRVRRAPHFSSEQARLFHVEMQIDAEVGIGPTFQGQDTPTVIPVLDAGGTLRDFQVGENSILQAPKDLILDPSDAQTLFLNDLTNTTSWQIVISAAGVISAQLLTKYVDSYPLAIPFVSVLGDQRWTLQLANLGGGLSNLQLIPQGIVGRGPEIMLRWSDDGGKSWSDPRMLDCGQAGENIRRVITRRLGSSRDRIYEISMTDAADWKIIDAYLFTDPEDRQPTARYAAEFRKRA